MVCRQQNVFVQSLPDIRDDDIKEREVLEEFIMLNFESMRNEEKKRNTHIW